MDDLRIFIYQKHKSNFLKHKYYVLFLVIVMDGIALPCSQDHMLES